MTVLENLLLASHATIRASGSSGIVLRPRAARAHEQRRASARASCSRSSASSRTRDAYAGTLSGGQRKLLDLARVLMLEPSLVLLDEPMAGVSPTLRVELLEHILALRDATGHHVPDRRARPRLRHAAATASS